VKESLHYDNKYKNKNGKFTFPITLPHLEKLTTILPISKTTNINIFPISKVPFQHVTVTYLSLKQINSTDGHSEATLVQKFNNTEN
jgi:hypothetical protein